MTPREGQQLRGEKGQESGGCLGDWGGEGRSSLSSSSRQLPCIAYSCSRVSGSEAVRCRSSSDFIHSWYLRMRGVGGRLGLRWVDQQHGFRWVRRDRPGCPAPGRRRREDQEFEASMSDRRPSLRGRAHKFCLQRGFSAGLSAPQFQIALKVRV